MKAFISLVVGGAALASSFWASPAKAAWFTTYACGDYSITLREVGQGNEYSYDGRGPAGDLSLQGGQRNRGEKSWRYAFENGDATYIVEDYWGTGKYEPDSARLQVIQFNEFQNRASYVVDESCTKLNYGV